MNEKGPGIVMEDDVDDQEMRGEIFQNQVISIQSFFAGGNHSPEYLNRTYTQSNNF